MQTYEIRLLKADGTVAMIHLTTCVSDDEAIARVADIRDIAFDRYEIRQDRRKVAEGAKPPR